MVILKNISRNNNIISADYYSEGDLSEKSFMSLNLDTEEVIENVGTSFMAPAHVMEWLIGHKDLNPFPEEKILLWY